MGDLPWELRGEAHLLSPKSPDSWTWTLEAQRCQGPAPKRAGLIPGQRASDPLGFRDPLSLPPGGGPHLWAQCHPDFVFSTRKRLVPFIPSSFIVPLYKPHYFDTNEH